MNEGRISTQLRVTPDHIDMLMKLVRGHVLLCETSPTGVRHSWSWRGNKRVNAGAPTARWLKRHGFIEPSERQPGGKTAYVITEKGKALLVQCGYKVSEA